MTPVTLEEFYSARFEALERLRAREEGWAGAIVCAAGAIIAFLALPVFGLIGWGTSGIGAGTALVVGVASAARVIKLTSDAGAVRAAVQAEFVTAVQADIKDRFGLDVPCHAIPTTTNYRNVVEAVTWNGESVRVAVEFRKFHKPVKVLVEKPVSVSYTQRLYNWRHEITAPAQWVPLR
jgi:D-arabinose 1-dehydrogenase-like Zn-dependent alcohol dehydrogenase